MTNRSALHSYLLQLTFVAMLLPLPAASADGGRGSVAALENAVVQLAADRIDGVFDSVADSTRALGETYARLAAEGKTQTPSEAERWLALRTTVGRTTGLRTWPGGAKDQPEFQAYYPSFYIYNGAALDDHVLRQLDTFERFAPTVRAAYESFPFSWVYMTTADGAMLIYPYLPIDEAVHNDTPSETPFYRAANFEQRAVGWTSPYLDLVGAGMMITASYPVYNGTTLLGVMSRDITLKQLAKKVLSHLTEIAGSTALIVDGSGLAIGASDPKLAAEIDRVNTEAGAAALYYRTSEGIETVAAEDAVTSASGSVNVLVEQVLAQANGAETVRLVIDDRLALAQRIERTGWFVVLIMPERGKD